MQIADQAILSGAVWWRRWQDSRFDFSAGSNSEDPLPDWHVKRFGANHSGSLVEFRNLDRSRFLFRKATKTKPEIHPNASAPVPIQEKSGGNSTFRYFITRINPKKHRLQRSNATVHGKGVSKSLSFIGNIER